MDRETGEKFQKPMSFPAESRLVSGDLGTATSYGPPYMPTTCFGSRPDQFPPMYLFAAVSEGLWDGGSACGRLYKIRCLSGRNMPCKGGATVEVKVVDLCRQSPCPSTIAMSTNAFAAISNSSSTQINIEYLQI
ncbi:EG45-like domain containing protein isoform X2 [Malus domestica]|uniref:EG45-like domain containing protein isoform X2 n=1 Tax=Malus domestica TaxID=3750 RepID=UPI0039747962